MSRAIGPSPEKIHFYEVVGASVRRLREKAGMSQRQLSEVIDGSGSALTNIECGRTMPSFWVASQIARALKCTVDDLTRERESA